ncbi:hypothetical protein HU147_12370 [Planomicrobium chinense]|uniref:hypothetical protein n=1 Tax=Planococcus chinensis TaxID=272917 RepID=UPI001CC453F9|nr:hypothetical protein [Planococcus chinensis]MBZ5202014.1 hypothetical protein [Planococcus chinensis]
MAKQMPENVSSSQQPNAINIPPADPAQKQPKAAATTAAMNNAPTTNRAPRARNGQNRKPATLVPVPPPDDTLLKSVEDRLGDTADFYTMNQKQTKRLLAWSVTMMVGGLAALGAAWTYFFLYGIPILPLAVLLNAPAILLLLIGASFFVMHHRTIRKGNELHKRLAAIQDTLLSVAITKNMSDPSAKAQAETLLIDRLTSRNKE